MSAVLLDDLKTFGIKNGTDDNELQDMLDRAEAIIAKRIGPLEPVTVTETHYGMNGGPLILRKVPAIDLTSVSNWTGLVYTELTLSDYVLDPETGIVRTPAALIPYGDYQVTYTAGYATLPLDLEAAVLELTKHLWESQRVPGASRPGFQGYGGGTGDTEPPPGAGYLLPYRVQSLIEPYILPGIA